MAAHARASPCIQVTPFRALEALLSAGLPDRLRPLKAAAVANEGCVFPSLFFLLSGSESGLPALPAAGGPSRPHLVGNECTGAFFKACFKGGGWSHAQTLAWDGVPREPVGPGVCTPLGMHVASPGGHQQTISLKVN